MHRMFIFTEEQFTFWKNSFPIRNAVIDKTRKPESYPFMIVWCTHEHGNWDVVEYDFVYESEFKD